MEEESDGEDVEEDKEKISSFFDLKLAEGDNLKVSRMVFSFDVYGVSVYRLVYSFIAVTFNVVQADRWKRWNRGILGIIVYRIQVRQRIYTFLFIAPTD